MAVSLGLDIGSNSVGSAWVDLERGDFHIAVSVFPAGVDEQEDKRGSPKNQARRQRRSQRRVIHRRAARSRRLIRFLMQQNLLPNDPVRFRALLDLDPWQLRRKALDETLTPHEFGRVAIHLAGRRGAVGVVTDPEGEDEGKVKAGMDRLAALMRERGARTVGQLLADLMDERRREHRREENGEEKVARWNEPIRNRQYRMPEDRQLFAGRELIRSEFHCIVQAQRSRDSDLARMLTDDLIRQLDDPDQTATWRHRGLIFGQRRTYWDTGALGRCVLEPPERCVPVADRHASYFRVVETVNNIRIQGPGAVERPLTSDERNAVIRLLRSPLLKRSKGGVQAKSSASVTDIKRALGLNPRDRTVKLNIEADEDREINTDWFYREIVHGAIGEATWSRWEEAERRESALPPAARSAEARRCEAVNRAILRLDPDEPKDVERLRTGATEWWGLDAAAAERLVEAWTRRPKLEKRLSLSRRAILNLLPYMERFDEENQRWPTQQEARKAYARAAEETFRRTGEAAFEIAARRYATAARGLTARDRRFMRLAKHRIAEGLPELPPAPMLANPVVRKTIHEVRRHLLAYLRRFRRRPDRIVIEMARGTTQSARQRNAVLARNRQREKQRRAVIDEILPAAFGAEEARRLSLNQQRAAVDRVILARQQTAVCPYCGHDGLTDVVAARGDGLEVDHIVPFSRSGDNGLNNRVLVHVACNRGKGNRTPREWWGEQFEERVRIAERLFRDALPDRGAYFSKRDYARKWENFTREVREGEEFRRSQLTDTAYAARQVAAYLADALYDGRGLPERGDGGDRQRIFFTSGQITRTLRRDWQLFETLKPPARDGRHAELTAEQEIELAEKDRGDHRQHAIDALTIALTDPAIKNQLATWAARAAEFKETHGQWPRRDPIPPPWADVPTFRRQVLSRVYPRFDSDEFAAGGGNEQGQPRRLVVAHRPVKRRLVGAFHEETHYGPVLAPLPRHRTEDPETLFTNRIPAERITPNHLRVPEGWDELSAQVDAPGRPSGKMRTVRRRLAALPDPTPGKSGIVRDRALRDRIRKCLRANGLDPDDFSAADIKKLCAQGGLTLASGIPIKGVVLLRTNTDPVILPRKRWDPVADRMVVDPDPRSRRVYIGGNNHHVEIRQRPRTGRWFGSVISAFEAARRVRLERRPAVDRTDHPDGSFVMSLAEGEMLYARRKDRPDEPADYFVVCKLDKAGNSCRIHFAPHWDARKAAEQDRWDVAPADLKDLGPTPGEAPHKVALSPLGDVRRLLRD